MKNRNGFTLLELLATIIILGLLTTLVVGTVIPILKRSHNEYYKSQEKMLLLAGKEYFADHRSELPKEIGETSKVTLKTLIEEKYIDPIKGRNDNDCNFEKSSVIAQKVSNTKYEYYASLICEDDNYETKGDHQGPVIKFSPNKDSSMTKITVKMSVTDNEEVKQYRYIINKDGALYFDSSYLDYEKEITIELTEVGTYQIVGYANDKNGNNSKKESGKYRISNGLDCSLVEFESDAEGKDWINKDIEVKVSVPNDTFKYSVSTKVNNETFKKVGTYIGSASKKIKFDKSGKNQIMVTLYDNNGNNCSTSSKTYNIDKEKPICGSNNGSTSWTNKSRKVTVNCSDTLSGCSSSSFNETFTKDTKTSTIEITDNAGNKESCDVNVYVDTTPPKITQRLSCNKGNLGCSYPPDGTRCNTVHEFSFNETGSGLYLTTYSHYYPGYNNNKVVTQPVNFNGMTGTNLTAWKCHNMGTWDWNFTITATDGAGNYSSISGFINR